jgi:hypothetical protein
VTDAALALELVRMADEDGRVRAELARSGELFDGYHPRMRAIHDRHGARMVEILDAHGWPGRRLVGDDGARAAWLVVQHAIAHPVLQRRALRLLHGAPAGDVLPQEIAMLEDRILTFEGRSQRYGTQFDWDDRGELNPLPIDDPSGVDERRRAVGLPPLAEAIAAHRARTAAEGEARPRDLDARRRALESWCREVGWRT